MAGSKTVNLVKACDAQNMRHLSQKEKKHGVESHKVKDHSPLKDCKLLYKEMQRAGLSVCPFPQPPENSQNLDAFFPNRNSLTFGLRWVCLQGLGPCSVMTYDIMRFLICLRLGTPRIPIEACRSSSRLIGRKSWSAGISPRSLLLVEC